MSQQSPSTSPFASRSRLAAVSPAPSNGLISIEVSEAPEKAGEGRPRRHPLVAGGSLVTGWNEQITTLYDYFQESIRLYGKRNLFIFTLQVSAHALECEAGRARQPVPMSGPAMPRLVSAFATWPPG